MFAATNQDPGPVEFSDQFNYNELTVALKLKNYLICNFAYNTYLKLQICWTFIIICPAVAETKPQTQPDAL